MTHEASKNELEAQLAAQKGAIRQRLDALEGELASTPAAIRSRIAESPWIGIAAVAAVGAVVGLMISRSRRRRIDSAHEHLVEQYIDAVGDDVRRRIKRGREPEEAVRSALEKRTPVIFYSPPAKEDKKHRSFFREFGDLALKTALGFVVKSAVDLFTASFSVEKLQAMLAIEEERTEQIEAAMSTSGDGARPVRDTPATPRP